MDPTPETTGCLAVSIVIIFDREAALEAAMAIASRLLGPSSLEHWRWTLAITI